MKPKPRPNPTDQGHPAWCERLQIQAAPEVCRANTDLGKKPCQTCNRGKDATRPEIL